VHRWWTIVIPFLVVIQVALVGLGAFHAANQLDDKFGDKQIPPCDPGCGKAIKDGWENWFAPHIAFGYLLVVAAIAYGLFSFATRDRRLMKVGGITLVLFLIQAPLAWIGGGVPALGWLHPLNALLILGFTGRNAYAAWQERAAVQPAPATATA
jgi:hypothetical protein